LDLDNLNFQLASAIATGADAYHIKGQIDSKNAQITSQQNIVDGDYEALFLIANDLVFNVKFSYDAFSQDLGTFLSDATTYTNGWESTYNGISSYPVFNTSAFQTLRSSAVNLLFLNMTTLIQNLKAYMDAGLSSYPPSVGEMANIVSSINAIIIDAEAIIVDLVLIYYPGESIENGLRTYINKLSTYLTVFSFSSVFTNAEYLQLVNYIFENNYTNSNIILTDSMTPAQVLVQEQSLHDQSVSVLAKISQPRYEFSGDLANFIALKSYQNWSNVLSLGQAITIQKSDGTIIPSVLVEMIINYDDPRDFKVTFSNRLRLNSQGIIYADMFGASTNSGLQTESPSNSSSIVGGFAVTDSGISV
jgi:hypothetical protein